MSDPSVMQTAPPARTHVCPPGWLGSGFVWYLFGFLIFFIAMFLVFHYVVNMAILPNLLLSILIGIIGAFLVFLFTSNSRIKRTSGYEEENARLMATLPQRNRKVVAPPIRQLVST